MPDRPGFFRSLAGRLLPRACLLCESASGAEGLCPDCVEAIPGATRPRCPICALPVATSTPAACATCRLVAPDWDRLIVVADYEPPLDGALIALKFGGREVLARGLGELLVASWQAAAAAPVASPPPTAPPRPDTGLPPIDWLVPVPLSTARFAARGFNQAALIAAAARAEVAVTTATARPPGLAIDGLERLRDTRSQSGLDRTARLSNLHEAFRARRRFDGQVVGLVDDIVTTGATLGAAARALRAAGAVTVIGLAIARTPEPG